MPTKTKKDLKAAVTAKLTELRDLAKSVEDADRSFTADERALIEAGTAELADLKSQLKALQGDDDLRKAIADLAGDATLNTDPVEPGTRKGIVAAPGKGSIGERFVNNTAYKSWLERMAPNGRIPDSARGIVSPSVEFGGFKDILTGTDDTNGGVFVDVDQTGIYVPLMRRELTLVDFISTRQTGSDTVEYVRQTSVLDAAAPVPEASGTAGGVTGGDVAGTKPQGDFAFQKITESVKTIAVWVPATKRALSDASQLRGLIDQELRADLQEELEDQVMTGDGTGENFTGIASVSGTLSQAYSNTLEADGLHPLLETTRKALTALRVQGRVRPTAFGFHPADWETIDLARMTKNPQNDGTSGSNPTLHGLPVFQSEIFTEGVAWAADWRQAVLWDREQTQIMASDSHADFFIRNLVAVLAELRAAFGILKPAAFIDIDLTEL